MNLCLKGTFYKEMLKTFLTTIKKYNLLKKKDKVLVGVSGGADSLCLLHLLCALRDEFKLKIYSAHFNHCLRQEADSEQEFVEDISKKLNVKCFSEKKKVKNFFKGDSLEQVARHLRYDFFFKVCRKEKIKKLALAHHKDDLSETVLLRLIRGSGLRGLRGFLPLLSIKNIKIIRPLIEIDKESIIKFCKEKNIPFKIDKTNFEESFLRNKIRLKLIPLLKEFNPSISQKLYELAITVAWDYSFIHNSALSQFSLLIKRRGQKLALEIGFLKKLAPAIFNEVLRIALEEVKGNLRKIELKHILEIKDLITSRPPGSIVNLPQVCVEKVDKYLYIYRI